MKVKITTGFGNFQTFLFAWKTFLISVIFLFNNIDFSFVRCNVSPAWKLILSQHVDGFHVRENRFCESSSIFRQGRQIVKFLSRQSPNQMRSIQSPRLADKFSRSGKLED